jgi:phage antirepressor YoqD-like protein
MSKRSTNAIRQAARWNGLKQSLFIKFMGVIKYMLDSDGEHIPKIYLKALTKPTTNMKTTKGNHHKSKTAKENRKGTGE